MANLTENLKDSMTATFPREFDIPNAMTIQEIYDKLNARAAAFQMPFSVKGGIPGERVVFEKEPNLDLTEGLGRAGDARGDVFSGHAAPSLSGTSAQASASRCPRR